MTGALHATERFEAEIPHTRTPRRCPKSRTHDKVANSACPSESDRWSTPCVTAAYAKRRRGTYRETPVRENLFSSRRSAERPGSVRTFLPYWLGTWLPWGAW